jgi:glycosyltransferase involved in cell wall biosynthesis
MYLSITIPFYGSVGYLKKAVQSVLGQSDPRWRLVVIDDNYPSAEPADWLKDLNDDRITYIRNPSNIGVSANFNKCIEHADSDLMVILGGDDLLAPGYVRWALEAGEDYPDASFFQPGVTVVNENDEVIKPLADTVKKFLRPKSKFPMSMEGRALIESLARGNWLYFPSIIWRRSSLADFEFNKAYEVVQDVDLIMRLAINGAKLVVYRDNVFFYRRHRSSVSSKMGRSVARHHEEQEFYKNLGEELRTRGFTRAAKISRLRLISRLAATLELLKLMVGLKLDLAEFLEFWKVIAK